MFSLISITERHYFYAATMFLWMSTPVAFAAEYLDTERVAPKTAHEDTGAMETEFEEADEERKSFLERLRERKATRSSFRRDATLSFEPRLYEFDRTGFDNLKGEYLTAGGQLKLKSGRWKDVASIGLTYSYSTDLTIRDDDIPVSVLADNGDSLSVLSEAFVRLDARDSKLSTVLYRQSFNLPYLNRQDSRMIPNTFEAYRIDYNTKNVDLLGAYVTKMKTRDEIEFISMSRIAGSADSNSVFATGFRLDLEPLNIGAINYYSKDTINIFYLASNLKGSYENGIDYQLRTQLSDQRSVGSKDIGDFRTWHWGISTIASWRNIVVNLKYTITGEDAAIKSPWGGRPHFNSLMLLKFDRAGEQSSGIKISYSLDRWQLPDLSLSINYASGHDAQDETGVALKDDQEFDITLDYKPNSNVLKGLWVRLRYAEAKRGDQKRRDFRAIVNYPMSFL